ncbi:hypothetical protein CVT24_003642 [Panaeolus cyanescens]|uniref:Phosducin thioredoxin-like domain-containing protein n=1 Tax=Panaeolus cyanescens TaxID=181874 RepID=A0A409Y7M0_9AGAR|nr:hypothetical protein CVT24_003642 [Panaeolus cyanescens]
MSSTSKIESLASRLVQPNEPNRYRRRESDDEDDDEALFAELEEEIENDPNLSIREQGLKLLKSEMDRMKDLQENQHGQYGEVTDEKEGRETLRGPFLSLQFQEMRNYGQTSISPKYYHTRFLRVFVENVPWLVERLAIKVLPCVICFVDGVTRDRLVGFEELGNSDSFDTGILELRLSQCGVIQKATGNVLQPLYKVASSKKDDEEIFDLDD